MWLFQFTSTIKHKISYHMIWCKGISIAMLENETTKQGNGEQLDVSRSCPKCFKMEKNTKYKIILWF